MSEIGTAVVLPILLYLASRPTQSVVVGVKVYFMGPLMGPFMARLLLWGREEQCLETDLLGG